MAPPSHLTERERRALLAEPAGRVRVVFDTDAANEIDDQYTLAWALLSQDVLSIEGMYATPFAWDHMREGMIEAYDLRRRNEPLPPHLHRYRGRIEGLVAQGRDPRHETFITPEEGMERSYDEIALVHEKMGMTPVGLRRGSTRYMRDVDDAVDSPAARHLIERALADGDGPLYVVAIGALTNVASALVLEPAIRDRIVVTWTAAYPSFAPLPNASFNLEPDVPATRVVFECGVPLVYLPGYHVGAQLPMSLADVEKHVRGRGAIGDYLHHLYLNNPVQARRGITDLEGRTWVMWDMINVAWLLDPTWVPSHVVPTPTLDDDLRWRPQPNAPEMREGIGVERDRIFRDFYRKLEAHGRT